MYYYFDDKITTDKINNLITILSETDGEINLWFTTSGGKSCVMNFFIDYLNSIKERVTITITNYCHSAGTLLLLLFNGKIILDDDLDVIMFHLADRESYNFRKFDEFGENKIKIMKQDELYNKKILELIKLKKLFTPKQIKKYENGENVFIYRKQFLKWKL
jgi:hypothetical protein